MWSFGYVTQKLQGSARSGAVAPTQDAARSVLVLVEAASALDAEADLVDALAQELARALGYHSH